MTPHGRPRSCSAARCQRLTAWCHSRLPCTGPQPLRRRPGTRTCSGREPGARLPRFPWHLRWGCWPRCRPLKVEMVGRAIGEDAGRQDDCMAQSDESTLALIKHRLRSYDGRPYRSDWAITSSIPPLSREAAGRAGERPQPFVVDLGSSLCSRSASQDAAAVDHVPDDCVGPRPDFLAFWALLAEGLYFQTITIFEGARCGGGGACWWATHSLLSKP